MHSKSNPINTTNIKQLFDFFFFVPQLSLANPVSPPSTKTRFKPSTSILSLQQSYTRGTVIPCHIAIQSKDLQALDLLAKPKAIVVRLTRCVQHPNDAGQSMSSASLNVAMAEDKKEVERAVWWINPEAEDLDAQVRHLEGEIHLEKELQPSCSFSLFKVSVSA